MITQYRLKKRKSKDSNKIDINNENFANIPNTVVGVNIVKKAIKFLEDMQKPSGSFDIFGVLEDLHWLYDGLTVNNKKILDEIALSINSHHDYFINSRIINSLNNLEHWQLARDAYLGVFKQALLIHNNPNDIHDKKSFTNKKPKKSNT